MVQRLFACNWPLRLVTWAGTIGFMAWTASALLRGFQLTALNIAYFIFLMAVSGLLGFLVSGIASATFLAPLHYAQAMRNGAPYQVGDYVRIISGSHQGQVARVYEIWDSRQQVRVELGDEERKAVTDVFSYVQVCRHQPQCDSVDV